MNINKQRWDSLCTALKISPDINQYNRLLSAYLESHRAYHTLQHLAECLNKLDLVKMKYDVRQIAIVEVALWYHDAIYNPRVNNNEFKSALWACHFLSNAQLNSQDCDLVHFLIMATCHGEKPTELLHQLMVDIDLSILGAIPSRFEEYEQQIRQEYQWVDWFIYKIKRRELLESFWQSVRIYNTELFYINFEEQARENLKRSISNLS